MVADGASLEAGDLVSAAGLAPALPDQHGRLSLVRQSSGEELAGIVGVVEGRMELVPAPGKEGEFELHSVAGAAKPGDLVAITVLGAAQVKVAAQAAIQPGQRLTVGQQPGTARAMQSRQIEGMTVDEGGPSLGVALEPAENGLIWVLVNPQ
jgi:hypothetical protein